ncbi:Spermatogenesis-associated protein [Salix suchowensis]|nr:Spermatogenesis-associated protein [Salix suchowensis]
MAFGNLRQLCEWMEMAPKPCSAASQTHTLPGNRGNELASVPPPRAQPHLRTPSNVDKPLPPMPSKLLGLLIRKTPGEIGSRGRLSQSRARKLRERDSLGRLQPRARRVGEDDTTPGVGITSDAVKQFLAKDSNAPVPRGPSQMPFDQSRWSDAYSASVRSRSSSTGGNSNENAPPVPPLRQQASYDLSWQAVDEKDEMGVSEDDTDFEQGLDDDDMDDPDLERTSAAVIAEEGRGLIVQGEGVQLSDLHIQPGMFLISTLPQSQTDFFHAGTTHLIVGSSNTPNIMPAFLSNTVPQICNTLLALDISANFLGALPPCLVLISDCTGIATLPDCLAELERLHTISIRRNKFHSLPSWLCLLPALQTICVDGNPFQGPWKALVEPLLAKVPMTPMYPPSTPSYPLLSASIRTSQASTDIENTDTDESSDPPSPDINGPQSDSPDEESTITPDRAPILNHIPQPQQSPPPPPSLPRSLQRTRTTPNRAFHQNRLKAQLASTPEAQNAIAGPSNAGETRKLPGDRELRKMKSAGDIRRAKALGPSTLI